MPATTAAVELDEHAANDVARLAQLAREIAERTEAANEVKVRLRALGAGRWWHDGVEVLDVGTPGLQFDAGRAAEILPAPLWEQICEAKPSPAKAKAILPPALYRQCCTEKAAAVKTL